MRFCPLPEWHQFASQWSDPVYSRNCTCDPGRYCGSTPTWWIQSWCGLCS